jgi:hypothetical protein
MFFSIFILFLYIFNFNIISEFFILKLRSSILFKVLFLFQKINIFYFIFKCVLLYFNQDNLNSYHSFLLNVLVKRFWIEGDKAPIALPKFVVHHATSNSFLLNILFGILNLVDTFFKYFYFNFDSILNKNIIYEYLISFCLLFVIICFYFIIKKEYILNIPILSTYLNMQLGDYNSKKKINFELKDNQIHI